MRRSRAVLPGTTISAFICTRDNHVGSSRSLDTHGQPIHTTRHGGSDLHLDALLGSFPSWVVFHLSAIPSVHPLLSPSFVRHLALWTQSLRTVLFLSDGLYERHGRHDIRSLGVHVGSSCCKVTVQYHLRGAQYRFAGTLPGLLLSSAPVLYGPLLRFVLLAWWVAREIRVLGGCWSGCEMLLLLPAR